MILLFLRVAQIIIVNLYSVFILRNSRCAKLLRKIVVEDEKLTSKSKIDLVRFPPCHSALKPHLQRLNHHVALYKHVVEAILAKFKPYDDGQGWIRTEDGVLETVWSRGGVVLRWCAALPNSLVKLMDLVIVKRKKRRRRRKTKMDEFDFEDFSESDGER